MIVALYLIGAFRTWMICDAWRRRVRAAWYVALLLPLPLSDLVYFFAVKVPDFGMREAAGRRTAATPKPIAQLEREVERSASFVNRMRLAWALLEHERAEAAQVYFEQALGTHPCDKSARLGLGLSRLRGGQPEAAADTLTELVEADLAYEHYEAALALAEALFRTGRSEQLRALLEAVIHDSGELGHQLLLARYQLRAQDRNRARHTLRSALHDFDKRPDCEREQNGALATEARRLLRSLERQTG